MNFENQVNRVDVSSSPTKRTWTADSPKSVTSAALDSVSKSLSNIKLSPRKDDRQSKAAASPIPSPTRDAGYVGATRLAVDRNPTRSGISGLPVRKGVPGSEATSLTPPPKKFEIETMRELTEDEMAIIRSRESRRLATMSQMCEYCPALPMLARVNADKC